MSVLLPAACHKAARTYAATPHDVRDLLAANRRLSRDGGRVLFPKDVRQVGGTYFRMLSRDVRDALRDRARRATVKVNGEQWTRPEQAADLELQGVMLALYIRDARPPLPQLSPKSWATLTYPWIALGMKL